MSPAPERVGGRLILTPGDPEGVGAEVAAKALLERARAGEPVDAWVVGEPASWERAAASVGLSWREADGPVPGAVAFTAVPELPEGELPEVRALRLAVEAIRAGQADALVTGPIHKARLMERGFGFTGHTDFLGHLCGSPEPVMAFAGGRLLVALVTVHIPLARVPERVTAERVGRVLRVAHAAVRDGLRAPRPRLLVCGLNPHAGEDGHLGREEIEVIGPAVRAAQAEGVPAVGPISAEAAFRMADGEAGDMVIAMYHDQGLAPLKLVDFGRSVNWSLGLPIVRTSVDHGTARDIAGLGRADPGSMAAAIRLAERLSPR
jgi:4-hydroxythreonine-4-phosphate dehydrogenase